MNKAIHNIVLKGVHINWW